MFYIYLIECIKYFIYYSILNMHSVYFITLYFNWLTKGPFQSICITPFISPGSSVAHSPPLGLFWEVGTLFISSGHGQTDKNKTSHHICPAQKWSLDVTTKRCALLRTFRDDPDDCLFSRTSPAHSSVQVLTYIQHRLIHLSSTSGLLIFACFQNSLGLSERQ